jgi:hypothetical protein
MNPDENVVSVQSGATNHLPKGELLSWKRWKSPLFQNFVVLCLLAVLIYLMDGWHFKFYGAVYVVLFFLLSSMNEIGVGELKDRGYRRLMRVYFVGIFVGLISILFLCFTKITQGVTFDILAGVFLAFCFMPFPFALYLTRRQKTSAPQQVSADES